MKPEAGNISEVDIVQIALLAELACLDSEQDQKERVRLCCSALELTAQLAAIGGGSMGQERLERLAAALSAEAGSC